MVWSVVITIKYQQMFSHVLHFQAKHRYFSHSTYGFINEQIFVCLFVCVCSCSNCNCCVLGWLSSNRGQTLFYQPLHLASHFKFVFWWLILFLMLINKHCDCDTAYHINNTDSVSNIQKVDQIKDLGILYDLYLTFKDHIQEKN